ncbi:MAG: DUF2779 domain-containing protein [Longimicrobiales bacterium]|nr:DUF2779 domain-containing protein [Longimicrobiales bacterium]
MPYRLSKSRFVAGWQCPRLLWWKVHRADAPEMQPSIADQDRMEQGNEVGFLATQRYPGGVRIDLPYEQMREKVEATRAALAEGAPAIFEASFMEDGVFVAVDILERLPEGFRLVEVKGASSLQDKHVPDVAIQTHVLRRAGLDVREAVLMHVNKEYRAGGEADVFLAEDVLPQVEEFLPDVPRLIAEYMALLDGPDPAPCLGEQCKSMKDCPLDADCWPQDPDHIRRLYGVGTTKALELMARGVHRFGDIPEDQHIQQAARRQLEAWKRGTMIVEPSLAEALEPFRGPVGFLDFETVARAVPPWPGVAPWGHVPVQFSYHERQDDGSWRHAGWLAEGWDDPRPALARALVEATRGAERVAMYTGFERTRIRELAKAVPELADELHALDERLVDLKKVVQAHVAHPDFLGSYSIKDVITPLVPELGYDGMEVSDGMTASVELARLMRDGHLLPPEARAAKRGALLEYCELDTWAMVRLVERLEELCSAPCIRCARGARPSGSSSR